MKMNAMVWQITENASETHADRIFTLLLYKLIYKPFSGRFYCSQQHKLTSVVWFCIHSNPPEDIHSKNDCSVFTERQKTSTLYTLCSRKPNLYITYLFYLYYYYLTSLYLSVSVLFTYLRSFILISFLYFNVAYIPNFMC
jgi:hypothetical protein